MPLVTATSLKAEYDVIIVGSGAGGGQSADTLTMEGLSVLMIEAGRNCDPVKQPAMFQTNAPGRYDAWARLVNRAVFATPRSMAAGRCRASPRPTSRRIHESSLRGGGRKRGMGNREAVGGL